jgi:hypothetical protein
MQSFTDRLLGDAAGFMHVVMVAIGDRLGIWNHLADRGAATSLQIARAMGLSERHVREWLHAMAAAQYLELDPATNKFSLATDSAAVLTSSVGALPSLFVSYLKPYERLVETFRTGGGIPQSAFPEATYEAHERFSAGWYDDLLVQHWLPAAELDDRLRAGIALCDVGCGGGIALVKLAAAFPQSRFVGYDVFGPNVHRARERAVRAGVAERVQFHQLDAASGLPELFDVITTFDVVHDAVDPANLLRAIRAGLHRNGTYLCLEPRCDVHPSLQYGVSVLYGTSTVLAHGGAALGTCGVHEPQLIELATAAGFASVTKLLTADPCNQLYRLV